MDKIVTQNVNAFYSDNHVIKDVSLNVRDKSVTAFIGPSGCGKSTFLRMLNRMNDYIEGFHMTGKIDLDGNDIYSDDTHLENLRKKVGMVFQKPNPFPKSVYENVVYGLRIQGINKPAQLDEVVERTLKEVALWDEVKDTLKKSAFALSGGQQQ